MPQPNLLFLFPDQWRWDWLGCETSPYGKVPVRTPNIDALARRGVRFTQCRSNSPLCAPARACLSLGVRYERCGVRDNGQDTPADRPTVWRLLRDAGYRTLTCGKNDLHKKTTWKGRQGWTQLLGQYGFCDGIDQSGKLDARHNGAIEHGGPNCSYTSYLHAQGLFNAYSEDYRRRQRESSTTVADWPTPLPRRHYADDFCGRKALELLDRQPDEGPWALWVNFPGPHHPFDPPRELQQRYDGVDFPPPVAGQDELPCGDGRRVPINHQQIRRNYAAACEGIDEWVGWILQRVEQRGELDNTLVIFSSDHGEMLGDHGRWKKQVPQEGSVHVPLIVAGPGVPAGEVRENLVELIDLGAILLEAAGLSVPADWDARSPLSGPARTCQVSALGNWRMACDGRFKLTLTRGPDGIEHPPHLVDLATDPEELANVASDYPPVVQRLHAALAR